MTMRRPFFLFPFVIAVVALAMALGGCSSSSKKTPATTTTAAASTTTTTSSTTTTSMPAATTTTAAPAPTTTAAGSTASTTTAAPSSTVALSDFVGEWTGHSRGLKVTASGTATETVGDGCCTPLIDLSYSVSNPAGASAADATVTVVVTSVTPHPAWTSAVPAVGQTGTLHLVNGVITSSFTGDTYCDSAQETAGACGA